VGRGRVAFQYRVELMSNLFCFRRLRGDRHAKLEYYVNVLHLDCVGVSYACLHLFKRSASTVSCLFLFQCAYVAFECC